MSGSLSGPVASGGALPLRDYQEATIRALAADWAAGARRLAAVLPTGAGKTVIFAHLTQRVLAAGGKVLILAHRDELIEQAAAKLHAVAPDVPVGVSKGARQEWAGRRVVVGSVQTLARERRLTEAVSWRPSLVVVDECHHSVADSYMTILRALGCFDEGGPLTLGVTATLERTDRVALGEVWQKISYTVPILDLIRRRYLLPPRGRRVHVEGLDLRDVRRSRGDYQDGALGEAMMQCLAPAAIARAYREHASDRQGVAFLPTVQTAYQTAEELNAVGITAACVEGAMPPEERRLALKRSAAGEIQAIVNCMVLTEGADLPWVSCVVIGRPTQSAPLYIQMVGRGLRPYPGQEDALVLDVVGVGARHRLRTLATLLGGERIEKIAEDLSDEELAALDLLGLAALDLEEIQERLDGGAGVSAPEMFDGKLGSTEFEMFEQSHRTWLRTRRGVWFLEAGTGNTSSIIFLVPQGGAMGAEGWRVASVPTKAAGGRWVVQDPMDIGYAMAWGERAASELGGYTQRSASWRKVRPSDAQKTALVGMARGRELSWPLASVGERTRGEVSDEISIIRASDRVDHLAMVAEVVR